MERLRQAPEVNIFFSILKNTFVDYRSKLAMVLSVHYFFLLLIFYFIELYLLPSPSTSKENLRIS